MADTNMAVEANIKTVSTVEAVTPKFDNRDQVKAEELKIDDLRRVEIKKNLDALSLKISENIPKGSTILDVGCWGGETGVTIAANTESSLIQADTVDARKSKVGELKVYPKAEPNAEAPDFTGVDANVGLLVDVIHHVGYGNGWDQENKKPNPDGRFNDMMKFIIGAASGVKPDGKILIINTRPEADSDIQTLKDGIAKYKGLSDIIKII
jgi:hypothetical protein